MNKWKGDTLIDQGRYFSQTQAANDNQQSTPGIFNPGDCCPACGLGKIDYDGTLNLTCERCGWHSSGGGACT